MARAAHTSLQYEFKVTLTFRHSFHGVFVSAYVHTRNTRNLPNPPPQFLITRRHNKTPPLFRHLRDAVVGVTTLATARDPFKAGILGQPERNLVFAAQFFQLSHDAVRDAGDAFGQQTVHHGADHVELFAELNTKQKSEQYT